MNGAIVFDLDGTLIDSAPDLHASALAMLARFGQPAIDFAQTRSFIGNGVETLIARIRGAVGLRSDAAAQSDWVQAFLDHYNANPAVSTVLYPGVIEALDALSQAGWALGICTNKPEAPARAILEIFDLTDRFQTVVGGDTLPVKKPDPAPLFHSFAGFPTERRLFVGDSDVDAETAQAAGIPFALFTEGYRRASVAQLPHLAAFCGFDALPGIAAGLA
jgi:phosphoglycolate phosphatase